MHAGGKMRGKKRKAFQQPQSNRDPPSPSRVPSPPAGTAPLPLNFLSLSCTHTYSQTFYRPHLATFQPILREPFSFQLQHEQKPPPQLAINSPPALKHFIQPQVQFGGFRPELTFPRLVTSL